MCRQCEIKPVYEFTNQRKLCKNCFIRYFQKKVFYSIRKFGMIQMGDVIGYEKAPLPTGMTSEAGGLGVRQEGARTSSSSRSERRPQNTELRGNDFRNVVLKDVLDMFVDKQMIELIKSSANNFKKSLEKQGKVLNKIAISSTLDQEADEIVHEIIQGDIKKLNVKPVEKKVIKPLYLFLDEEVLLYAKLKKLHPLVYPQLRNAGAKFRKSKETPLPTGMTSEAGGLGVPQGGASTSSKPQNSEFRGKDKISKFINELEKKHPEIKRAIVKGWLKVCD